MTISVSGARRWCRSRADLTPDQSASIETLPAFGTWRAIWFTRSGRDPVDAIDCFLQRDRAAPQNLLARELTGAGGWAFERHQQSRANSIADTLHFYRR